MGVINKARLDAIARNYRALFFAALERPPAELSAMALQFFLETQSTAAKENYNWIGDVPEMEDWKGDRPHLDLEAFGFELENVDFATGIKLRANDIEDDRLALLPTRINSLVSAYNYHVYKQLVYLIENGDSIQSYDSKSTAVKYFWSTTHSSGSSGSQINYATGAGSTLTGDHLRTYRAYMKEYVNDKGKKMMINPTHVWCGTGLEGTLLEIIKAERNAYGATNVNAFFGLQPIIIPGLASSTMWGLVDLSHPLKPFIKQLRRPVNVTALTDPKSPEFYHRRECLFGVDYRGAYGVGLWQAMFRADGA